MGQVSHYRVFQAIALPGERVGYFRPVRVIAGGEGDLTPKGGRGCSGVLLFAVEVVYHGQDAGRDAMLEFYAQFIDPGLDLFYPSDDRPELDDVFRPLR
jgi:hypothetical protein